MSTIIKNKIKNLIKEKKVISPKEIENILKLTKSKTWRYLIDLEKDDYITRNFGEVIYKENQINIEKYAQEQVNVNVETKKYIAKTASVLANKYKTVYIDGGSNCYYLLEFLDSEVTLFTNSIYNATRAMELGFKKVNIIGGEIKAKTLAIINLDLNALSKFKFEIAFLGVNAIDKKGILSTPDPSEGIVKKFIAENSEVVVVMAESEKFDKRTFYDFTPENKVVLVVTDDQKPKDYKNLFLISTKNKK